MNEEKLRKRGEEVDMMPDGKKLYCRLCCQFSEVKLFINVIK